jgi:hypothetical protein
MPPLRKNPVKGLKRAKKKLNRLPKKLGRGAFAGQVAIGLEVKKDGQKEAPRRESNLANSAYITTSPIVGSFTGEGKSEAQSDTASAISRNTGIAKAKSTSTRQFIAVGYGVIYAMSAHENPQSGAPGYPGNEPPRKIRRRATGKLENARADEVHSQVGQWKFHSKAIAKWYAPDGQMNAKSKKITRQFMQKELSQGG